jgi:hypothetical protein
MLLIRLLFFHINTFPKGRQNITIDFYKVTRSSFVSLDVCFEAGERWISYAVFMKLQCMILGAFLLFWFFRRWTWLVSGLKHHCL